MLCAQSHTRIEFLLIYVTETTNKIDQICCVHNNKFTFHFPGCKNWLNRVGGCFKNFLCVLAKKYKH